MPHLLVLRPNLPASPCLFRAQFGVRGTAILHLPRRRRCPFSSLTCAVSAVSIGCKVCCNSVGGYGESGAAGGDGKVADLATLGNLCVDIVLGVPELPPEPKEKRRAYMERLAASRPDKKYWEAGGNCNLAIAAARLGLRCVALGYVGDEMYGDFLVNVLHDEGISTVAINEDNEAAARAAYETLLCWVLVDPLQRHGFCSRADFSDEPAFNWMVELSQVAKTAIKQSKVLFCNGYVFDELSPALICSAVEYAIDVGTSVFFDPGPRGKTLSCGTMAEQKTLHLCLTMCDVLLLTAEEAQSLTGMEKPVLAGKELIRKGLRTKWVIIKMGADGSMLITSSAISCAPAFKVDVVDTVGCGDSYVAAIAYGFLNKVPSINTLLLANAVGAATATGSGAGRNVARLEKVVQLLSSPNLNEDSRICSDLVNDNFDAEDVIVLSNAAINGTNKRASQLSIQQAVYELLQQFEVVHKAKVLPI